LKSDAATLDSIFADTYVDTDEHSHRTDKQGVLSVLKSGELKLESIKLSDMQVYVYGDAAVVTGSSSQAGNFKGQSLAPKICAGLLLRSAESLAARYERKHQPAVRQYFPRGMDLSGHSQAQLDQVALRLNQRPTKTLGFQNLRVDFNKVLRRPSEPAALPGQVKSAENHMFGSAT
jgi:hypothetical protein